jgi:hypothetical protein
VFAGLAAMIQNVGIGAAGFFEGVGQNGQTVESAVVIDRLSQLRESAFVPRQPSGTERDKMEEVAPDVTKNPSLGGLLGRVILPKGKPGSFLSVLHPTCRPGYLCGSM